jgi:hypothetical protein
MLNVINTKLLAAILAVLAGIASYFAYEKHKQEGEERKAQQTFQRLQTEGQRLRPRNWDKSSQDYRSK